MYTDLEKNRVPIVKSSAVSAGTAFRIFYSY